MIWVRLNTLAAEYLGAALASLAGSVARNDQQEAIHEVIRPAETRSVNI